MSYSLGSVFRQLSLGSRYSKSPAWSFPLWRHQCDPVTSPTRGVISYDDMHTTELYQSPFFSSLPFSLESLFAMYGNQGQTSCATSVLLLTFFFIHMVIASLYISEFVTNILLMGVVVVFVLCWNVAAWSLIDDVKGLMTSENFVSQSRCYVWTSDWHTRHVFRRNSLLSLYFEILGSLYLLDGFHRCLIISECFNSYLKHTTHDSDTPYIYA